MQQNVHTPIQQLLPSSEGYDRIPNLVDGCQDSGILTFINILVKLCIYPYIVNHVIWIALFGIQESLESSQESWNQARNLGILPRFQDSESRRRKFSVRPLAIFTVGVVSIRS